MRKNALIFTFSIALHLHMESAVLSPEPEGCRQGVRAERDAASNVLDRDVQAPFGVSDIEGQSRFIEKSVAKGI